jgi:hypothetical protein
MIRVNLLEGTAEQRVSIQKTKVAARRGQQLFMVAAALVIYAIVIGIDYLLTNNAHADAKAQLDKEQAEATKLQGDIDRKNQLEAELKQVEERIKIIKQLRAEQKGPVAMLSAINERLPGGETDFKLSGIADFARQLEFSNGLFTNVKIRIEERETKVDPADKKDDGPDTIKAYGFTITCDYNKPRAEGEAPATAPAAPTQGK